MMKRREREFWVESYFDLIWKHRKLINVLAFVLFVVSIFFITRLQLKPEFSHLLPHKLESVQNFEQLQKRFGSAGKLLVAIESPSFKANKAFSEALAEKLRPLEGTLVRYFDYRFEDVQKFFETYGLHYLETPDLFRVKNSLREEIRKQKDQAFGNFLGFDDLFAEEPKPETQAISSEAPKKVREDDLTDKLDTRVQRFLSYPDAYLGRDDGKLLVISIMTKKSSLSQKDSQELSKTVSKLIADLKPESFDPAMHVSLSGQVQKTIDELRTIKNDIVDTAVLLACLILGILVLFMWSVRWISLLLLSLVWGVAITFGLTEITVGYLNTMTAFLASLVVGTGINYGIILIFRFVEERKKGLDPRTAMIQTISSTAVGTILASSTTAASFVSLLTADNKGFSQFGIIGSTGVIFCWLSAFILLPIWIYQLELKSPARLDDNLFIVWFKRALNRFGDRVARHWVWVLGVCLFCCTLGISGVSRLFNDPLEYDFSKLRNRDNGNIYGSFAVDKRIQKEVYNSSLSPAIVLLKTQEQARELCPRVRSLVESLPPERRVFESCVTMYELLPKLPVSEEESKVRTELRTGIQDIMGDRWLKFSDAKAADWMQRIHQKASQKTPQLADIPDKLLRPFEELSGERGLIGLIYPNNNKPLEDGRNLLNFTQTFRYIWLPKSETMVSASGENFVLADLLRGVKVDGPKSSAFAFISVLALAFLLTGSLRSGFLMSCCMTFSIWVLFAIQGFMGIKFNFLNFIALPLTFGIGVDYPINIFLRMKELDYKRFGFVLSSTGLAVILCTLTTICGYFTLFSAANQALVSFAKLALLGEFTSIASAIFLLPALVKLFQSFSRGKNKEKDSIFHLESEK